MKQNKILTMICMMWKSIVSSFAKHIFIILQNVCSEPWMRLEGGCNNTQEDDDNDGENY